MKSKKFQINDLDEGLKNLVINSGKQEIIEECPWILDLPENHSQLYLSLCEASSLSEIMKGLHVPSFMKVSKVGYFHLNKRVIKFLKFVFLTKDVELTNSAYQCIKDKQTIPEFDISYYYIPIKYISFYLKLKTNEAFSQETFDFLKANYPPSSGKKIKIKTHNGLLRSINKWHESLWAQEAENKSDDKLDYGDIPHDYKYKGISVIPLLSEKDFFIEGKVMKHCVSSYFKAAKNDRCRVFSLIDENKKKISTLEIIKNEKYSINQHKSVRNTKPSKLAESAAYNFIKKLNSNNCFFGKNKADGWIGSSDSMSFVESVEVSLNNNYKRILCRVVGDINLVVGPNSSFRHLEIPQSVNHPSIPEFSPDDVVDWRVETYNHNCHISGDFDADLRYSDYFFSRISIKLKDFTVIDIDVRGSVFAHFEDQ